MTNILALDLGTTTGWAVSENGKLLHGVQSFKSGRYEGGGMRFLRFTRWLDEMFAEITQSKWIVAYEEVRSHVGTDAAHAYGGFMATLTNFCEMHEIPYVGYPVGTIKKHLTGKGNANKGAMVKAVNDRLMQQDSTISVVNDNEADAIAVLWLCQFMMENKLCQ